MGVIGSPAAHADPGPGAQTSTPAPPAYVVTKQPITFDGVTDLSAYRAGSSPAGSSSGQAKASPAASGSGHQRVSPLLVPRGHAHVSPGARSNGRGAATASPDASSVAAVTLGSYPHTQQYPGINGPADGPASGFFLEPPDQGLCVGGLGNGNATAFDFVNNSLQAYSPSGQPQSQLIPATQLFGLSSGTFLSDPRCYWDHDTRRWFFTEFTSSGPGASQYIAVSQTDDPLGRYSVFSFNTADVNAPSAYGCPCFGDFDQIGADLNGFYVTTNEFSQAGTAFNGTDIWAMSKRDLVKAADAEAPPMPVTRYAVTADEFGAPYHVSPSQTPPDGSYFPNTELFVESNSDLQADNRILTYDMTDTSLLASGGVPPLNASSLNTLPYSNPPNANQDPAGSNPAGTLQADFNAVQEVTYSAGKLYAELDTGGPLTSGGIYGSGPDKVEWFILDPQRSDPNRVTLLNQGYLSNPTDNLLYPDIAVDGNGDGYLLFSVSGTDHYPSPGYIRFDKYAGPQGGTIHLPTSGVDDEDGFTCYPPFSAESCRWGDYSMGVSYENRIFMATEYIPLPGAYPATPVNWGTYMWNTPDLP